MHPPPRKRGRGTARSAVEGARAVENILGQQEKRRLQRPSHRAPRGPPIPASAGRDEEEQRCVPNIRGHFLNQKESHAAPRCSVATTSPCAPHQTAGFA